MLELFGGHAPTPRQLLGADPDAIRAAGLSRARIAYLRDLAVHVEEGTLKLERLPELPDDEVMAQLTAIKGLGEWTAHMFLMFHLRRPDVLPVGDQGIRRAAQVQYRCAPRTLSGSRARKAVAPYRTLACLFLWSGARQQASLSFSRPASRSPRAPAGRSGARCTPPCR